MGFIYKVTNNINNKVYVGKSILHKQNQRAYGYYWKEAL